MSIRHMMVVDGFGYVLPWLLNISLTVLVYGVIDIPNDIRYFVLTTFGLVRLSIAGLGRNLNMSTQAWSSLTRIS